MSLSNCQDDLKRFFLLISRDPRNLASDVTRPQTRIKAERRLEVKRGRTFSPPRLPSLEGTPPVKVFQGFAMIFNENSEFASDILEISMVILYSMVHSHVKVSAGKYPEATEHIQHQIRNA